MTVNKGLFSSDDENWETPQLLYDILNGVYNFTVDVCANASNAKHTYYWDKESNGLARSWQGHICWMNPPYGRSIGAWVKKAHDEHSMGNATVVALVPARTDTAWWHDYVATGYISFLRGRLKFGGATNGAPFPSAVVVWSYTVRKFPLHWDIYAGLKHKQEK